MGFLLSRSPPSTYSYVPPLREDTGPTQTSGGVTGLVEVRGCRKRYMVAEPLYYVFTSLVRLLIPSTDLIPVLTLPSLYRVSVPSCRVSDIQSKGRELNFLESPSVTEVGPTREWDCGKCEKKNLCPLGTNNIFLRCNEK